jgi:hypothetical protein
VIFTRFGGGLEYKIFKSMAIFFEFNYDRALTKLDDVPLYSYNSNSKSNNFRMDLYGYKAGIRYIFNN